MCDAQRAETTSNIDGALPSSKIDSCVIPTIIQNTKHKQYILSFSCLSHYPPSLHPSRNFVMKHSNVPSAWNPAPTRSSTRNAIIASVKNVLLRRAYTSAIMNAQPAGLIFQHIEHVAGIRNLITL